MKINPNEIIGNYLRQKDTIFTSEEFVLYLRENGIRISKAQAEELLYASDYVFSLVDKEFVTRAGVFTGRYFSFKPSREEIDKGYFIIGHRCVPFVNPEIGADSITVISDDTILKTKTNKFSMNLALDTFTLFGDGYVIPYIINDKGNTNVKLGDLKYNMPSVASLTSWPLKSLKGGDDIKYGDRVLCSVTDWENSVVKMEVIKDSGSDLCVSNAIIEREEWYSRFEKGILESIERHGPCASIEEQLAFLYLENQSELCIRNCGSIEEFLSHTKKIDFKPYGVESRIWKIEKVVPFTGPWNKGSEKDQILMDLAAIFTPMLVDGFLKNNIYEVETKKRTRSTKKIFDEVMPKILALSPSERNVVLLNIEKRRDIIKANYNPFIDYTIADMRKRTLSLFSEVCSLFCSIGCSTCKISDLPQLEFVILSQLYNHLVRLLEEFENQSDFGNFPMDDIDVTLDGMEDTFEDISEVLEISLELNKNKGFEIVSGK